MPVNGEKQFAMLKRLASPDPYYMTLEHFGEALKHAYEMHDSLRDNTDHPERANWWECMIAIHSFGRLRFGARPWSDYLKQTPAIYNATSEGA